MTETIAETAENLADDSLYVTADDDPDGIPAGQDGEEDAPYGWTIDKETGQPRPKKRPGRPKHPPGPEDLTRQEPVTPDDDAPPPTPKTPEVPMPRGGVIARGVDRLYRRAGKILRVLDKDIGQAVIECTRAEDPEDLTVGQAWEALCRENPRIRAFVLRLIKGGAWGDLLMAHLPIALAIGSKPAIQRLIPWQRVAESFVEPDEDSKPGDLRPADVGELAGMAQKAAQMAAAKFTGSADVQRLAAKLADGSASLDDLEHLDPGLVAAAERAASSGAVPAAFRRQPRQRTRAQRRHK